MNLEQFLDHYGVEYSIQGDRVVAKRYYVDLIYKCIAELPEDIDRLVCGILNLSYNLITRLPDSIFKIKTCDLNLSYNKITEIPESIGEFVGDWLNLDSNNITKLPNSIKKTKVNGLEIWGLPMGRPTHQTFNEIEITDEYIYCDNDLTWYKSKKKLKQYNIYKGYFDDYVIQDGDVFAHADSIKECISDIIYKKSDRDKSKYKGLNQDEKMLLSDAVLMYRVITGACSGGTQSFLDSVDLPKELSINDVKVLTAGRYGNEDFVKFFKKE